MITKISLTNFKNFGKQTNFDLSKLNLLTGINGRGKSSFLQSLLIIRQSLEEQNTLKKIIFNGSCVNLGTYSDVRNRDITQSSEITLKFHFKAIAEELILQQNYYDDMIGVVKDDSELSEMNKLIKIHYIAADRVGPQEFYMKSTLPEFINVGTKGEYVANVLLQKKEDTVHDNILIKKKEVGGFEIPIAYDLLTQTGEWLSRILDNDVKIFVENEGNVRIITLLFQIGKHKELRPTNVGFGYTYILPIIVSGLIAKEHETLIVENPEAHLHPKAQHELVLFLAKVANTGVQVFIESHSEHILNSLRILLKDNKLVNREDVSILFFQNDNENQVTKIELDEAGLINNWPKDFFDQTENDLKQLIGF